MRPADDFDDLLQAGMTVLEEPLPKLPGTVKQADKSQGLDIALAQRLSYGARIAAVVAFRQKTLTEFGRHRLRLAFVLFWLRLRLFAHRYASILYFLLFVLIGTAIVFAVLTWQVEIIAWFSSLFPPSPAATTTPVTTPVTPPAASSPTGGPP